MVRHSQNPHSKVMTGNFFNRRIFQKKRGGGGEEVKQKEGLKTKQNKTKQKNPHIIKVKEKMVKVPVLRNYRKVIIQSWRNPEEWRDD